MSVKRNLQGKGTWNFMYTAFIPVKVGTAFFVTFTNDKTNEEHHKTVHDSGSDESDA